MPKPRVLRVYVNSYTYIDPEGRPAGVFPHDPAFMPGQMHVGLTRLQTTVTEKRDPSKDGRSDLFDLLHHYDAEIQELPDVPGQKHYRDGIREGSLIPADEATAKAAGVPWEEPGAVIERWRLKAVRDWTADHGEPPAFATDDAAHAHVPMGLRGSDARAEVALPHDANALSVDDARRAMEAKGYRAKQPDVAPDPFPTDDAARDANTEKGGR